MPPLLQRFAAYFLRRESGGFLHSWEALWLHRERANDSGFGWAAERPWWCWLGVGLVRLAKGTSIDPNKLAKVTRGDVARSVVATGKIQPITKVEVKSKASGIVEKLYVDINNRGEEGPATGATGPAGDSGAGGRAAGATGLGRGQRGHVTRPISSRTR
jgi:hypothetical protein